MAMIYYYAKVHRGEKRLFIKTPNDVAIIQTLKSIAPCRWSQTERAWHFEASNAVFKKLKEEYPFMELHESSKAQNVISQPTQAEKIGCPLAYTEQLQRMRYSENTAKTYTYLFTQFINYFPHTPIDTISEDDIHVFMQHLLLTRKVSASTQNQAINAIKFYYEKVRKETRKVYALERPLKESKLPKVLSEAEVAAILKSIDNLKHKAMLYLIYAAGLRRSELIQMKVCDVDSQRMVINILGAKGKKDRITLLSEKVLNLLRIYFKEYKPKTWLFEGAPGEPYSASSLQKVFVAAHQKSGIKKAASLHTLRHSFATHLLESGTDIRYIQSLLGHNSSKTTEIYTHVTTKAFGKIRSPLDNLDL
jgi:integrase/recombinase XerD